MADIYWEYDSSTKVLYLNNTQKTGYTKYVAPSGSANWPDVKYVITEPWVTGRKLSMPANLRYFFNECSDLVSFDPAG
jgi:hypothetical protein